ncbi:Predicted membrane protein [Phaffia rhodozyma]|uniref:Predicted membrane protein n=1 Tax=Phaffia rhodozyma TaxID=264483 RepID=A0A0F7SVY8_PHARH|nr:Predicted membrane protein [Phaffia rhodozyma]
MSGEIGAYHSEKRNVAVHVVFVPTIFWTYMFFMSRIFPSPLLLEPYTMNHIGMALPFRLDLSGGSIVSILYAAYYFALDAQTATLYLPLLVLMGGTSAGLAAFKPEVLYPMLILHVASWVAQIVSHKIFEGKAPALLDNLVGALVLAPFFTFFEVLFLAFDYRPELKKQIENESGNTTPIYHPSEIGQARAEDITPLTTLELRVRLLEYLISGSSSSPGNQRVLNGSNGRTGPGLMRKVMDVQDALDRAVDGTSSLERFVDGYEQNANLLSPPFSLDRLSNLNASPADSKVLSIDTKISLLMESEDDFKSVSRGLEEVEALDRKGVVDAGDLSSHHALLPRLSELVPRQEESSESISLLENRLIDLLGRYDDYVSNVSDAFLELNRLLGTAEAKVGILERSRSSKGES